MSSDHLSVYHYFNNIHASFRVAELGEMSKQSEKMFQQMNQKEDMIKSLEEKWAKKHFSIHVFAITNLPFYRLCRRGYPIADVQYWSLFSVKAIILPRIEE